MPRLTSAEPKKSRVLCRAKSWGFVTAATSFVTSVRVLCAVRALAGRVPGASRECDMLVLLLEEGITGAAIGPLRGPQDISAKRRACPAQRTRININSGLGSGWTLVGCSNFITDPS